MHKNYNIISNFFSLLTNHINIVKDFNNQTNEWLLESNDIYYEAYNNDFGPLTINDLLCLTQ